MANGQAGRDRCVYHGLFIRVNKFSQFLGRRADEPVGEIKNKDVVAFEMLDPPCLRILAAVNPGSQRLRPSAGRLSGLQAFWVRRAEIGVRGSRRASVSLTLSVCRDCTLT